MIHAEFDAAAARFDADLVIAASGSPAGLGSNRLRRRAMTVYRNALEYAAGHPFDPRWRILALIVEAFITRVGNGPHTPDAAAALERLTLLRDDGSLNFAGAPASMAAAWSTNVLAYRGRRHPGRHSAQTA